MWRKLSLILLLACCAHYGHCECSGQKQVFCDSFNDVESLKGRETVQSLTILGQISPHPCLFPLLPGFHELTYLKYDNGYTGLFSTSCMDGSPKLMYLSMNSNRINLMYFQSLSGGAIKKISLNNNEIKKAELEGIKMHQLEELDLSKNLLQSFNITAKIAPKLRKLLLRRNKIRTIKIECPMAREVNLQNNLIESFESSDLILPKVERLYLARNRLIVMSSDMLKNVPKLTWLTLENNALFNVAFPRNNEIKTLNLRRNKIRTMDAILFGQLNNNQTLVDLSHNKLEELKSQTRPNINIHHFVCMHCGIKFVDQEFIDNCMPNVQILILSNNLIATLDIFSWVPLKLTHIDMSYNLIEDIVSRSLDVVPKLETLILKFNKIRTIGAGSFDKLPNLRNVSLDFNCIRDVYNNWLLALSSVPHLGLEANLLTYFPIPGDNATEPNDRVFKTPPSLRWNPLQCSCYNKLLNWIASSNDIYNGQAKSYESEGHRPVCIVGNETCSSSYRGDKFFLVFKARTEGVYNQCDL